MNFLLYSSSFLPYFSTFFIAVLPFVETRGAIPIGMALGLHPVASFICSYLGSLLPVPFLLLLLTPFLEYINNHPKFKKLSQKFEHYIHKNVKKIKTQGTSGNGDKPIKLLALFLFVVLPAPGTGVWGASVIASVLKLKKSHAFFTIAFANFFSGLLIFLATFGFFVN